ncbi:hypothetical protein [Taibaiella koreensis]|uniref:hypothetical protein n=1 Tax=Taibaiella koreensis TaxID=1268548 RepID=UPI000E59D5EB|nr:hypothetical protein [Taibaiella koreensis]
MFKINRIDLSLIVIFTFLVSSCQVTGTWTDGNIDPKIEDAVEQVNIRAVNSLRENNPDALVSLCSDPLLAVANKQALTNLVHAAHEIILVKSRFEIKKRFYMKTTAKGALVKVASGATSDHNYEITFRTNTTETMVMVGEFTSAYQTVLLLAVYGNYNSQWKLNILKVGINKLLYKDAIAWYKEARSSYNSSDTIDAFNKLSIANKLLKPGGEYWTYDKEKEIREWTANMQQVTGKRYHFPVALVVNRLPVSIIGISPQFLYNYYPEITYVSTLPLSDTKAQEKECDSVHHLARKIFPYLARNNDTILYRAFNDAPKTGKEQSYGFARATRF